jgi:hypothetical protein
MEVVMSEMRELTDTEAEEVCGGLSLSFPNIVTQTNTATQVGIAVGGVSGLTGGNAGNAAVAQLLGVANFSLI